MPSGASVGCGENGAKIATRASNWIDQVERLASPGDVVLFDAVGTLIEPDPPVAAAYAGHAARFGSNRTQPEILARFRAAFAAEEARDRADPAGRTDETRERRRWRGIVRAVFADDVGNVDGLFEALWEHFARPESWRVHGDAAAALARFRALGIEVGVASNLDSRLERIVSGLPALGRLDHLFISSRLGYRKPSSDFFKAIEQALGLGGDRLILVGDDVENDIQGATRAGWRAILVQR